MQKIAIIRTTGFVGTNLCEYLIKDNFVIRQITRTELADSNPYLLANTYSIVHLAGKAHDLKKAINLDEY